MEDICSCAVVGGFSDNCRGECGVVFCYCTVDEIMGKNCSRWRLVIGNNRFLLLITGENYIQASLDV